MGRHGVPPVTPLSAALTLQQWTLAHGRPPGAKECRGSGGLFWHTTYYERLGASSWSMVLATASALVEACASADAPARRKMKACRNAPACAAIIVDEGHHVRYCARCRQRMQSRQAEKWAGLDTTYTEPLFTRTQLERWGLGRDGWISDIDWSE